MYIFTYMYIEL